MQACPHCDAPLTLAAEALDAREAVTCGACEATTELDGERAQAQTKQHLRRTFASTGPFPLQLRRYRVALEELAPGGPLFAYFPAIGRRPFAVGDNQGQVLETLRMAAKIHQRSGRVQGELPPSDARDDEPWLPFEA